MFCCANMYLKAAHMHDYSAVMDFSAHFKHLFAVSVDLFPNRRALWSFSAMHLYLKFSQQTQNSESH